MFDPLLARPASVVDSSSEAHSDHHDFLGFIHLRDASVFTAGSISGRPEPGGLSLRALAFMSMASCECVDHDVHHKRCMRSPRRASAISSAISQISFRRMHDAICANLPQVTCLSVPELIVSAFCCLTNVAPLLIAWQASDGKGASYSQTRSLWGSRAAA